MGGLPPGDPGQRAHVLTSKPNERAGERRRSLDRRHLDYFLAVAEAGSFTRAAAKLSIAQPSLSHSISALERELDAQLFERLGRGVRLRAARSGRLTILGLARRAVRNPALIDVVYRAGRHVV
jgi:hypothetical protein